MERSEPHFTPRQRQVIELIAAGYSNAEIGRRLGVSARTAKAHCDVLRRKLGVLRRRQIPAAFRLVTGDDPLPTLEELRCFVPAVATLAAWPEHASDMSEALELAVRNR